VSVEVPIGSMVSNYRIERQLGSGAMGTVYLARDVLLDRLVAIKLLAAELARDERFRTRFLRESRTAARLDHPGIVPIHAAGEADGTLFLAMRYVEGADLRQIIKREAPLDADRVVDIVRQVAEALDAAHEAGLVHRDVKPGNIMVDNAGRAYLCDFGLAKHSSTVNSLTRESAFVGTIDYIAPEQIQGGSVDGRADEYALGCVLYESLTGCPPFHRDSDLAVVFAHLKEPPPLPTALRPELADGIDAVVSRALAKHPAQRYPTCAELAVDAAVGLAGGEVDAPPPREAAHAFLITDIRGYTRYTQQHGDDAAAQLSERFIGIASSQIEQFDGRVMATHGDEVVSVFESPRRALRAALAVQAAVAEAGFPLGVGVGLDAGEAVEVGDDYRGGALNTAARLCSAARGGEVLASEPLIHLARRVDGVTYLEGRIERLKGIEQPVKVVEVVPAEVGDSLTGRIRRRMHGRRWGRALVVAGALIGAIVGIAVVSSGGGTPAEPVVVPGNSVAVVDPAAAKVVDVHRVGTTPTDVAGDGSSIWTLNEDASTVSRVVTSTGQVTERGLGVTPVQLAYGAGSLWVAFARDTRPDHTFGVGVLELDPDTLAERRRVTLPGRTDRSVAARMLTVAGDGLIALAPSGQIVRLNPGSPELIVGPRLGADAAASDGRWVWIVRPGNALLRLNADTLRVTRRVSVPSSSGIGSVAVGGGSVWGAEPYTGLVWRTDIGSTASGAHTVRAGLSASDIAFGDGAVWVTSGVDGTLVRIDPSDERVKRISLGGAPPRVAVVADRVLVTVAGGGGAPILHGPSAGVETLPAGSCGPLVYGGEGKPDYLIASDLPMDAVDGRVTAPMVQAIEFTLRSHDFKAGDYRIGFQACDDSTAAIGTYTDGKCEANATSYATTPSVLGVVGPFNSGCAMAALPALNAAGDQPVPVVSPTNSYIGLTRVIPGISAPADLHRLYLTGVRNYVRTYPADDAQADADAALAVQLGAKRVAVIMLDPKDSYATSLAHGFARAAKARDLELVRVASASRNEVGKTAAQLRSRRVDAILLAGLAGFSGGNGRAEQLLRTLDSDGGRRMIVIAPDGWLPASMVAEQLGTAAQGMYISGAYVTDPEHQLPSAGVDFIREFSATQPDRVVNEFTPYAAAATEVLLRAIAASDGTRLSVIDQLFKVRIENGVIGSFGFTKTGDMTPASIPVFRVDTSRPPGAPDRVFQVIEVTPPN
jgi:class 3 adenylate cyclase/ABC-type branched-subunit amino acid transport system substrate-binding protein